MGITSWHRGSGRIVTLFTKINRVQKYKNVRMYSILYVTLHLQHCMRHIQGLALYLLAMDQTIYQYHVGFHGYIIMNQPRGLYLQVETVILAGTLILLLMTANTLILYSMPASSPDIVQVVVFPGILISNWMPDKEIEGKKR